MTFTQQDLNNHRTLAAQLRERAKLGHLFADMDQEDARLIAWHDSMAERIAIIIDNQSPNTPPPRPPESDRPSRRICDW